METLFALAVSVTDCVDVTEFAVAVKPALVAFCATLTLAGTVTVELLLDRFTLNPPLGAALVKETVQESDAGPASVGLVQVNPLSAGGTAGIVIVPPVAVALTESPDPSTAYAPVRVIGRAPAAMPDFRVNVALATTPLEIGLSSDPYSTQVAVPLPLSKQSGSLFTAVASAPALKDTPPMSAAG